MRRVLALACAATLAAAAATAQTAPSGGVNALIAKLLTDGYEVKAAFAEAGVPYLVLQKGTSAFLCRGGGAPTCEKLN